MTRGELEDAISLANVPTLLPVLVQLTGDLSWLEEPFRPTVGRGLTDNDTGGLPDGVQQTIRSAAVEAIAKWLDGEVPALEHPDEELLVRLLSVSMGESIPSEYGPMIAWELDESARPKAVPPRETPPEDMGGDPGLSVVVIGAGMSGICAAVRLSELGIPFTVLEKSASVGGVWVDNRYPGAGVDTPNHLYSYSFAPRDWAHYFSLQEELSDYFAEVALRFNIMPKVRLEMNVESTVYNEDTQRWTTSARDAEGRLHVFDSAIVISAVGVYNPPKFPEIEGLENFAGRSFHTAEWPSDFDAANESIAVIGNGASAMQAVPRLAETAPRLTVFQRSAHWVAPFEQFGKEVPAPVRSLLRNVPMYRLWYRLRLGWTFNDKLHASLHKDEAWPFPDRAVNETNNGHRRYFSRYAMEQLRGKEDLIGFVIPTYPPFGKRILMDNGWFAALRRPNVSLVTEPIARVVDRGIVTASGVLHEVNAIVLSTGFDATRFLGTFEVAGRGGLPLQKFWEDDNGKAYLGIAMPNFPNFFCLYGPNTQTGHGGTLIHTIECQMNFVADLIQQMLEQKIASVECRDEVFDQYNAEVDERHDRMVWSHPGMTSYYRNSRGRVVVNSPFRVVDIWHATRHADLDDFILGVRS